MAVRLPLWARLAGVHRPAKAVAFAATGDAAEQGLHFALPRHLGELVDRGDDKAGEESVELLVDDHGRDPLARPAFVGELATPEAVTAVDERAPPNHVDV